MLNYLQYLERWSKRRLFIFVLGQVIFLGLIDLATGSELASSIFYLIPISTAAWLIGPRAGMVTSFAAALSWLLADILPGHTYSHFTVPYWNTLVRLGFFVIVTAALSEIRKSRAREAELQTFIVHDLRSPLSIVMTGIQTLQDMADGSMPSEQVELIELCMVSCNRMLVLINSILDLARLQSGKMPLHQEVIEVEPFIKGIVESIQPWARQKELTLSWSHSPNVQRFYADPVVTERILVNLLSNAIKFSTANSEITIQVVPHESGMVALGVTDQGKGIRQEEAVSVFDKFVQVGTTGTMSGSGLGLAFCRLAVEAQHGRIWISSIPDRGSTVMFTLPSESAHEQ